MGRSLTEREKEALRHIRNFLLHHGRTPSIRELQNALGYKSHNPAAVIIDRLVGMGLLAKKADGTIKVEKPLLEEDRHARTVNVPLVGRVAAGTPIFAEENLEGMFPVSVEFAKPPHRYFLLRVIGDSMNQAGIDEGDLVLVKQQPSAEEGQIVVALIDEEATVKEFHRAKEAVVLRPRSSNPIHRPIILTRDFQVQGIVEQTISDFNQDSL